MNTLTCIKHIYCKNMIKSSHDYQRSSSRSTSKISQIRPPVFLEEEEVNESRTGHVLHPSPLHHSQQSESTSLLLCMACTERKVSCVIFPLNIPFLFLFMNNRGNHIKHACENCHAIQFNLSVKLVPLGGKKLFGSTQKTEFLYLVGVLLNFNDPTFPPPPPRTY